MKNFSLPKSIIPENDAERILKLHAYAILNTPAEHTYDKIAMLAAQVFDAPMAQITFVDQERVFLKTNISPFEATEINRQDSFCAIAILAPTVTVFEDISAVSALSENPFVKNGVRFYAGAPLRTKEGLPLGTICVLDTEPKQVTEQQLKMLETLASIVMDQLELRLTLRKAMRTQVDMMNRVVHDLKNPNTTISLSAELIKKRADDPKIVGNFADRIKNSANGVLVSLNKLLDLSQIENGSFRLSLEEVDIIKILATCKKNFERIAAQKQQRISISSSGKTTISADSNRLQEAFENLLSNALKFSHPNSEISLRVTATEQELIVEFSDQGLGLNEEDMAKLFTKFAKLSAYPTAKEHSNGLGLSIAKMLIELHHGKIWAESKGKDQGTSFFVSLPVS